MVHYSKVVRGAAVYAETELVSKLHGTLPGWLSGAAVAFLSDNVNMYIGKVLNSQIAREFGFVDGENINVEVAYKYILAEARKGSATITLPFGMPPLTLTEADVEALYKHIKGA